MFEYTINQLNNYFAEAERASCSTYCESCLYCLTGYLISICTETHYEKCLRKVAKFVSEQNDRVYKPRGLLLTDPTTRGLRLIEISVLDRPASWLHISRSREFFMWPPHAAFWTLPRQNHGHARARECLSAWLRGIPVGLSRLRSVQEPCEVGGNQFSITDDILQIAGRSGVSCTINLAEYAQWAETLLLSGRT